MTDDDLVIDFVPALVVLLHSAETSKGSPLTEAEVIEIRDNAVAMRVPRRVAEAMADSRGYDDLDPEQAWEEWQEMRRQLG